MRVHKRAARAGKTFLFACSVTLLPSLNATPPCLSSRLGKPIKPPPLLPVPFDGSAGLIVRNDLLLLRNEESFPSAGYAQFFQDVPAMHGNGIETPL